MWVVYKYLAAGGRGRQAGVLAVILADRRQPRLDGVAQMQLERCGRVGAQANAGEHARRGEAARRSHAGA